MNCTDGKEIKPMYALFGRILRMHHSVIHTRFEELGVHPGQPALLRAISMKDGLSQKELAEELHVSAPTVAVTLKRMERVGFIERRQDPDDQRITRVYLTDAGRALEGRVRVLVADMQDRYFKGFTEGDEAMMTMLLEKIMKNLVAERNRLKGAQGAGEGDDASC